MDWAGAAEATGGGGGASGYWQLALILAAIGLLGLFSRWRKSRLPPLPAAKELREREQDPDRYRNAADKAIVEILETSRSLNAQVDTKIRALNRLVKDAEDVAERLEKLLAEARSAAEGTTPANALRSDGSGTSHRLTSTSASTRMSTAMSTTGAAASAAMPAVGPPGSPRTELQERIRLLRKDGKSLTEIAKATNLSTTEVKFAIASMHERAEETHE